MPIRLIALDVDGTLTHGADSISQRNLDAIHAAQRRGVFVTIATGRGFSASRPIWQKMGVHGPVINYGGAQITDTETGEPVYIEALPPDVAQAALSYAHQLGLHAQIYQGDVVITERDHPFFQRYCSKMNLPREIDEKLRTRRMESAPKILVYAEPEIEDRMRELFAARLDGLAGVSKSEPGFIEINCASASKGKALSVLAERLGVSREETAALGDSYLDISMIEWAGDGVAMANGLPEVKAVADRIVTACADDGVAEYIERFVL